MSDSPRRPVISLDSLHQQSMYEKDSNPLRAWKVYKICRQSHYLEIPPWVLEYLDEVADNLLAWLPQEEGKGTDVFVKSALKVDSGRDFTTFFASDRKNKIADRAIELIGPENIEQARRESKRPFPFDPFFKKVSIEFSVSKTSVITYFEERIRVSENLSRIMQEDIVE